MNFTSLTFLPLFFATLFLYYRLPAAGRRLLLLVSSWGFFIIGSPYSSIILLFVTTATYSTGRCISAAGDNKRLKMFFLAAAVLVTIGTLAAFKYTPFFFLPAGISFYSFQALSYCIDVYRGDFPAEKNFFRYALFVSFFPQVVAGPIERPGDLMRQLDGYGYAGIDQAANDDYDCSHADKTVNDDYRFSHADRIVNNDYRFSYQDKKKIEDYGYNHADMTLNDGWESDRAKKAGTNVCHKQAINTYDFRIGGFLMLRGYAKKIIIADGLAHLVDTLFSSASVAAGSVSGVSAAIATAAATATTPASVTKLLPAAHSITGPATAAAALLFALQIYADFSGYSDIARGSARLLGIRLSENFREPYLAHGMRDFWRRWHITLNRWMTDYVYIPLGGNRSGKARTALNTLIVFALSGLWHGNGMHFVLWGVLHGLFVLLDDLIHSHFGRRMSRITTFCAVSLLWILFRSPSIAVAAKMYASLPFGWIKMPDMLISFIASHKLVSMKLAMMVPLLLILRKEPGMDISKDALNVKTLILGYCLFLLILICLFINLQSGGASPFIYFQF